MSSAVSFITTCRLCKGTDLKDVVDLGEQFIASRFPKPGDPPTPKSPLILCMCQTCWLLQLRQSTIASELYEQEYGYRSGINSTMRTHLQKYTDDIISMASLKDGDTVLDIGSNDSTMLHMYSETLKRIGMDPTGKQFAHYYDNGIELVPTYFTRKNFQEKYGDLKCKAVSSIAMFYDLPDPVQFAKDIYDILCDDGIWTCEQSYMPSMLKTNSLDTICHEHLEYYALHQIVRIANEARFKIIGVQFNSCNGGSFRIYLTKTLCTLYPECTETIQKILADELALGIDTPSLYLNFLKTCDQQIVLLKQYIRDAQQRNEETWVYGASTKGNVLLQWAGLDTTFIRYAVDRNPDKVGKTTPTGIPIISEETMRASPPRNLLVLPWHFRDEIVKREQSFLEGGGSLIFPLPVFEVVRRQQTPIRYLVGGKLGDFNQSLSVVCEMFHTTGRKGIVYLANKGDTFRFGLERTFQDTQKLVCSQTYIHAYEIYAEQPIDIDLTTWRKSPLMYNANWYDIYKSVYGIEWGAHPWITVPKNPEFADKILISYSADWYIQNIDFEAVRNQYGTSVYFISQQKAEYNTFVARYGISFPYIEMNSLYDLVCAIASCRFFIGGMSSPITYAFATHTSCIPGLPNLDSIIDAIHNSGLDTHLKCVRYSLPTDEILHKPPTQSSS